MFSEYFKKLGLLDKNGALAQRKMYRPFRKNGDDSQPSTPIYYPRLTPEFTHYFRCGMADSFTFVRPMEAPTFSPSEEEWQDPMAYINKIRPVAERAGICKIIPPGMWQPPFAVDVDQFKFTPRIQRLNELEAKTRVKLNFLDQIAKFWELQGQSLRIPVIEKKALDLYTLSKLVEKEGGMEHVNNEKKWNRLAARLGLSPLKNYGLVIKQHYEKILYPYDVFEKSKHKLKENENEAKNGTTKGSPTKSPTKHANTKAGRMSAKNFYEDSGKRGEKENTPKELKRLMFYGAGPKMAGYVMPPDKGGQSAVHDPLAKYMCLTCNGGEAEEKMLLCDGCDDSYHTFCLDPPLQDVPKGDWRCPKCVAEDLNKPSEAFGFEQASREYSLHQFGEMADQFKSEYFNMPVHLVPLELVEKEFWRIVAAIDEDVTVEYGADLHTMDHGSGFPTKVSNHITAQDDVYINSGWNLNNLPNLPQSVLGHINADISGMKVPWMYVGMCFSTFCWHNEDHWSYSINYLHWGEPKTWYGVPGGKADQFEEAMKGAAPELFQSQPDLLHQLVTIMNPNILMNAGVPVYRMDQCAGEFIITFPRAYHAGFNQGYNFAEAVNFAPADWLPIGRECINHYSALHRYCVFSHDELVSGMASRPDSLSVGLALSVYEDFKLMAQKELKNRAVVKQWGAHEGKCVLYENLPDDERLCDFCKTTCFLSTVHCTCSQDRLVCIRHYDQLCQCPPAKHYIQYRYTIRELQDIGETLFKKCEHFKIWLDAAKHFLVMCKECENPAKNEYRDMIRLLDDAKANCFPGAHYIDKLQQCSEKAKKLIELCEVALGNKRSGEGGNGGGRGRKKKCPLSVDDLRLLCEELDRFPIRLPKHEEVMSLIKATFEAETKTKELLDIIRNGTVYKEDIKNCIKEVEKTRVEIPEVEPLKEILRRLQWVDDVEDALTSKTPMYYSQDVVTTLIQEGSQYRSDSSCAELLSQLKKKLIFVQNLEFEAESFLSARKPCTLNELKAIVTQIESQPIEVSNYQKAKEVATKLATWLQKVSHIENLGHGNWPNLEVLQELVNDGKELGVDIKELHVISAQIEAALAWVSRLRNVFLKKNSTIKLIDAVAPRPIIPSIPERGKMLDDDILRAITTRNEFAQLLQLNPERLPHATIAERINEIAKDQVFQMVEIRKTNFLKWLSGSATKRFCVCRSSTSPFMVRCELCFEWYHVTCTPLPKVDAPIKMVGISSQAYTAFRISVGEHRYLCACCSRSKVVPADEIHSLVRSLDKLPVKTFESEAFRCLVDRYNQWEAKVTQFLEQLEIQEKLRVAESNPSRIITSFFIHQEDFIPKRKRYLGDRDENDSSCNNAQPENDVDDGYEIVDGVKSPLNPEHRRLVKEAVTGLSAENAKTLEHLIIEIDLMGVSAGTKQEKLHKIYNVCNVMPTTQYSMEAIQNFVDKEVTSKELTAIIKKEPGTRGRGRGRGGPGRGHGKKRKKSGEGVSVTRRKSKKALQENDEDCAADVCKRPVGSEVCWVQCDGVCQKWYHIACLGIDKKLVCRIESYVCDACRPKGIKVEVEEPDNASEV